jgi:hypothetical protein
MDFIIETVSHEAQPADAHLNDGKVPTSQASCFTWKCLSCRPWYFRFADRHSFDFPCLTYYIWKTSSRVGELKSQILDFVDKALIRRGMMRWFQKYTTLGTLNDAK